MIKLLKRYIKKYFPEAYKRYYAKKVNRICGYCAVLRNEDGKTFINCMAVGPVHLEKPCIDENGRPGAQCDIFDEWSMG